MYHSFFIHLSTDGHLGCFQILAIVNSTTINIGVHIFFSIGVLKLLGYIAKSILVFLTLLILLSAHSLYAPFNV